MGIKVYHCVIKLLDPLYYSREGLSASFTPPYLHATALNLAIKNALNIDPHEQPYLITDSTKSRNIPRYVSSLVSDKFYFTPARLVSPLKYFPEVTKGENDGYFFKTEQGELFQAGVLNYIPPESIFQGFLIEREKHSWPKIFRLGSFRGKAELKITELEIISSIKNLTTISHPIDPIVTTVKRGIAINMFPYPIVENPQCVHGVLTREKFKIAFPDEWNVPDITVVKGSKSSIII